jgi:outer membrane protein OmpA-like peptidoglycan-associated protein
MTLSKSTLALVALLVLAPAAAFADATPGWYVGAGLGMGFSEDSTGHTPAGNRTITYDDPNTAAYGGGGYAWNNGFRAEGEVFYDNAAVDKVGGANGNGHLSNLDFFANGLYDFKTGMMFTPYVGAGAGLALVTGKNIGVQANGGTISESDHASFAYQGIVGAAAQLDHNWAVTADYRYIDAMAPALDRSGGGRSRTTDASHNILIGLRYSFDKPEEVLPVASTVAPRPVARPAPAVAAPKAQASYVVFFDFDKTDLTPEAQRILASAAEDYKNNGYAKIVVSGNTDTVGSDKYNDKLSLKRAKVVKAELVRLGINAKAIATHAHGKKDLLVKTPDGKREVRNRRTEIVLSK